MKPVLTVIVLFYGLLTSCYIPYNPDIDAKEKILVVEGMITNELAEYKVRLSYALPFDSKGAGEAVSSARVYVTDNAGNYFIFSETGNGYYRSNAQKFRGQPGSTYTLSIETSDGEIFMSGVQRLEPEFYPDTVYAEADYEQTISRFNQIVNVLRGANIMVDIQRNTDTLPRFRFIPSLVKQYFYALSIPPPLPYPPLYSFYCWQTDNNNLDINLVHKEYSSNSSSIKRHKVFFVDNQISVMGRVYGLGSMNPDGSYNGVESTSRDSYTVSQRILYLDQYTLNNDSYKYYKGMEEQLSSEGKIFDPIAAQLAGNIKCTTNPELKVFGFFEASSVSHTVYRIGYRNPQNDQYKITKLPYIKPSVLNGCLINKAPAFWVF